MRFRAVTLAAIGLLMAGLFAIPGCSDKTSRPDPCFAPPGSCTSPEAALLALKQAYNTRAPAALDSLLAEDFTFVLSPEDAGQPGMPSQWGRNAELDIHARMLDPDHVQALALDFVIGPRVFDEAEQLWTITITLVDISLYGTTPDHPTPRVYQVRYGTAKFWFREMTWNAPCSGERAWKIAKWEDEPVGAGKRSDPALPPEENTTWGTIKWLFHS
jgi:hypothetical protein